MSSQSISEICCADDLAALAREAVQQVRLHKQYRDLIGAILMANHVADWYFKKDLGRAFNDSEKDAMKSHYPEWDLLRQLANGTKHCKAKVKTEQATLEWEDADFWDSLGHVGRDGLDWFVDFDGRPRSVAVVIETFLDQFADIATRPS
jgi:hypothetical protein